MKKIYTLAIIAAMFSNAAIAQDEPQLPNADFEGNWATCKPWTSNGTTTEIGQNPENWTIANVAGMKIISSLQGTTQVGEKANGYNSASSVKVYNSPNPKKKDQIVPGYFTLGTTWSTTVGLGKESDGGTFGGIEFTGRPESVTFMYKRTHGTEAPEEQASVVAYLWKGTYKQENVPGCLVFTGTPTPVDMIDRDRNILNMSTAKGGEVTQKGTLIAKINHAISGDAEEWTELTIPFEYVSDETPEKFNIIFCAGDYFSTNPGKDNALYIDNVKLNYPEPTVVKIDIYKGLLNVKMGSDEIANIENQLIYMDEMSNGKYTLRLENFGGTPEDPEGMGNIIVNNVTITDGIIAGHADGIKLAGGIEADADVTGTLNGVNLELTINCVWKDAPETPIIVTFNGQYGSTGITDIESDDNTPAEYYNLNGVRVNGNNMTPGIYICRKGAKVSKVLVK